ncbi:hypothetical protein ACM66B_003536 [Microbotryomycetes sp. NB124-2]
MADTSPHLAAHGLGTAQSSSVQHPDGARHSSPNLAHADSASSPSAAQSSSSSSSTIPASALPSSNQNEHATGSSNGQPLRQPGQPDYSHHHMSAALPAHLQAEANYHPNQQQQHQLGMHRPHIAAPRSASWHAGHPPIQDTRTQLSVSNLPFRVRWQDLKDLMRKCGTVLRADVALSPVDGRSRGFGVVLFARHEDAMKAIDIYHGFAWQTRILDVRIDSHDPRGEIALAEANRQQAMQQQAERFQQAMQLPQHQQHHNFAPHHVQQYPQTVAQGHGVPLQAGGTTPTLQNASHPPSTSSPRPSSVPWPASSDGNSSDRATASPRLPQHHQFGVPQTTSSPLLAPTRAADDAEARTSRTDIPQQLPPQTRSMTPLGHDRIYGGPAPPPFAQGQPGQAGMIPPSNYGIRPPAAGLNPVPAQYVGRHLFVGNLPFNCQWQELKDLMRQCGNVLRADIATGPDGRSRGFGSVLFATSQDAERAVQQLNGFDFNGRPLKVHFDKYSSAIPPPGHAPNGSALGGYQMHHHPPLPPQPSSFGSFGMQLQQQPDQRHTGSGPPPPFAQSDRSTSAQTYGNGFFEHDPRAQGGSVMWQQPTTVSTSLAGVADDLLLPSSVADKLSSAAPNGHDLNDGNVRAQRDERTDEQGQAGAASPSGRAHHPSRISMPPPSTFPFSMNGGPLSPITGGRLPPMTPSMPAFTLGAFPQTPPVYPQSFFSPGVGPFSPQVGSPYFGPNLSYLNGGMNAAPGAPVHRQMPLDYNPMFPMTTQSGQQQHQYVVVSPGVNEATDGETTPLGQQQHDASYFPDVTTSTGAGQGADGKEDISADTRLTAPMTNRNASAPNLSPQLSTASNGQSGSRNTFKPPRPDVALHSRSADPITATSSAPTSTASSSTSPSPELEHGMSSLKLDVASSSGAGWAGDLSRAASTNEAATIAPPPRRRSYVPGAPVGVADLDVRRRFERDFATTTTESNESSRGRNSNGTSGLVSGVGASSQMATGPVGIFGGATGKGGGGGLSLMAQEALQARRASFEDVGQIVGNKQRMKFGTSIWGTN